MTVIEFIKGDITQCETDAVVNAANTSLLGGGGVDGAIHVAAGKDLLDECRALKGCKVGEAKITKGYGLKAKYVIHTVGPVFRDGTCGEEELLKKCYINSLHCALIHSIRTIAFPCISTGAYRFPKKQAACIAYWSVKKWVKENKGIEKIIFVCFSNEDENYYSQLIS